MKSYFFEYWKGTFYKAMRFQTLLCSKPYWEMLTPQLMQQFYHWPLIKTGIHTLAKTADLITAESALEIRSEQCSVQSQVKRPSSLSDGSLFSASSPSPATSPSPVPTDSSEPFVPNMNLWIEEACRNYGKVTRTASCCNSQHVNLSRKGIWSFIL